MIRRSLGISAFLFVCVLTHAQLNFDSLWRVWNDVGRPDSSRIQAMHKISWDGYLFSHPDSAFLLAQLLYDFAREKNLKEAMAKALRTQKVS